MIRYLTVDNVLFIHKKGIDEYGGSHGILDEGRLDASVAQPQMTFGGNELYPTLPQKAAALGFSLIMNHPFEDGNKRVGYASMKAFLLLNDRDLRCSTEHGEAAVLAVARGDMSREQLAEWVDAHSDPRHLPGEPD